jgi:hypothetical protein
MVGLYTILIDVQITVENRYIEYMKKAGFKPAFSIETTCITALLFFW